MLKNAKGYRSPYINALNDAVRAQRIVGGDVTPEESPNGTLLYFDGTRRARRFELFCGFDTKAEGSGGGQDALCLGDGTLYVAAVPTALTPGRDVYRREAGLMPRGSGWCTHKAVDGAAWVDFLCCRYGDAWYVVAQKEGEALHELLPEALGELGEGDVERVFSFGRFQNSDPSGGGRLEIRQDVHSDVYYGGSGGATAPLPFELRVRQGDGGPFLDVYAPQGVSERFLSERGDIETVESRWAAPLPSAGDAGWYTYGPLSGAPFTPQGRSYVVLNLLAEDVFALAVVGYQPPDAGYEVYCVVGVVTRSGEGTEAEPYAYTVSQLVAGAFRRAYAWLGTEALLADKDGTLTDDLDSVTWTRTTQAFLCRLYGIAVDFPSGGCLTLANPSPDIPVGGQDGKPVFATKLSARAHAADHIEDFIPFDEAKP